METLRQWAVSLIISGIAGAVISLISPRGTMEKTLRTVIGIFMVSAVCSPLTGILEEDGISLPASEQITAKADSGLEDYIYDTFDDTLEETVETAAETLGIEGFDVIKDVYIDEYNCIIIRDIHITIPSECSDRAEEFAVILEKNLGFSVSVECR